MNNLSQTLQNNVENGQLNVFDLGPVIGGHLESLRTELQRTRQQVENVEGHLRNILLLLGLGF